MISEVRANYIMNIGIHVFILFCFLTLLFFKYIATVEVKNVDKHLTSLINEAVTKILSDIPDKQKYSWANLRKTARKIQDDAKGQDPKVKKNNTLLQYFAGLLILLLLIILILTYVYFTVYKHININIKEILIENGIIFSIVAVIEFLFFTLLVSKI